MANTLDMVGLVWRVLQLSPKPFGTEISTFIGPGSRTEITIIRAAEKFEVKKYLVLCRTQKFLAGTGAACHWSLSSGTRTSPLPEKTPDILSSSVPFNISIPSTLDLAITLLFLCFPTTLLFVGLLGPA